MPTAIPPPRPRPRAALAFRPELDRWLLPPPLREAVFSRLEVVAGPFQGEGWRTHAPALGTVEVLIGSWGIPRLDAEVLAAMPRLRAVLYGAGSVHGFVTPEFWRRDIALSSAAVANAAPTAAFAEAMIVLALKHTWFYLRERRADWAYLSDTESSGLHGATVGVIGLGAVGRRLLEGLRRHEMRFLVCDPALSPDEAARLGVTPASLADLFARSDVVSLHAPLRASTVGMIRGAHLRGMKRHATFVNTARGALVREDELAAVLQERPDLTALLDVTDPEPAPEDSPLRRLPNVVITPHLAGARHREIELIGRVVVDELERWLAGEPLRWRVDEASGANRA